MRKNRTEESRRYYLKNRERILAYNAQYRERNRETLRTKARKYYKEYFAIEEHLKERRRYLQQKNKQLKIEVLSYYSNGEPKCAFCREADIVVLTIDHIDGRGREHMRQIGRNFGKSFYFWLRKHDYPKGYQVLCFNCNIRKHYKTEEERCDR